MTIAAEEHLVTLIGLRNEAYDARVDIQQKMLDPDVSDEELRRCLADSKSLADEILRLDKTITQVQAQIDRI